VVAKAAKAKMKWLRHSVFIWCWVCAAALHTGAQGTFQNLDFEDANIVLDPSLPYYPNSTYTASALPGWTIYGNFIGPSVMLYNAATIGSAAVSIQDGGGTSIAINPWQGSYSLYLQNNSVTFAPVAIGQVGTLPGDIQSVTFFGDNPFMALTFNGHPIPLAAISSTPSYTIYGGNISAYAGQTGELRLQGFGQLDNIHFSNQPIPEPTTLSLFGLGLLGLGWWRRQRT
jgi:hypothetical protein